MSNTVSEILRIITSSLRVPTIIVLLIFIVLCIIMIGSIIVELITERSRLKCKIPELLDSIQNKNSDEIKEIIKKSGLLKRQKSATIELLERKEMFSDTREALARQILFDESSHYEKITKISDVISRLAPMVGLMGTLIPLGPGLIGLGQGDTKTLTSSLLMAFDTTVVGLVSAAVAYTISAIRKQWYESYQVGLETILEAILVQQDCEKEAINENK